MFYFGSRTGSSFFNGFAGFQKVQAPEAFGVDWKLPMQEAINLANITARTGIAATEVTRLPPGVADALTARGWTLRLTQNEASGLHGIRITETGFDAGADPRREGVAKLAPSTPREK